MIFQGGGGGGGSRPPVSPSGSAHVFFPMYKKKEEEEKLLDDKLLELESQRESKVAAWQAEDQILKELDVKLAHVLIFSRCINNFPPCIN